jgi:hypothetical protein
MIPTNPGLVIAPTRLSAVQNSFGDNFEIEADTPHAEC